MTSNTAATIPEWLQKSSSEPHITAVLRILTQRERARESIRAASRHITNPSRTHRLAHLPQTILKNPEEIKHYSVSIACKPENRKANRYIDVEPYDRTRVVVCYDGPEPLGRYLNASWVREWAGGKWWIASQAPLPQTAHAFLSVIMQPVSRPPSSLHPHPVSSPKTSRVRTIVQLTRNVESGMRKAHIYFPCIPGQSWIVEPEEGSTAPPINVALVDTVSIDEAHCVLSTVALRPVPSSSPSKAEAERVTFRHMLFTSWPDHGVPEPQNRAALLKFIHLVDEMNHDVPASAPENQGELDPDPPAIVHCSAGIGRTGSFIALSSLLRAHGFLPPSTSTLSDSTLPPLPLSPLGPLPDEIKDDMVAQEVDYLREQRPGMVQREDQVLLIYDVLLSAFVGQTDEDD